MSRSSRLLVAAAALVTTAVAPSVASATPTTVFGPAARLSSQPSVRLDATPIEIKTNAQGDELAIWNENERWAKPEAPLPLGNHRFFSYRVPGGTWAPKVEIEPGESNVSLSAGLSGDGTVTIATNQGTSSGVNPVKVLTGDVRAPITAWTTQTFQVPTGSAAGATVLTGAGSTTSLVFTAFGDQPGGTRNAAYATQRRGGDPFPAAQKLADDAGYGFATSASAAGDLALVWQAGDASSRRLRVVTRPVGGSPSPVREVAASDVLSYLPAITATPGGGAVLAWTQTRASFVGSSDSVSQMFARRVSASGALGAVQALTAPSVAGLTGPMLAADDTGRVTAAWTYAASYVAGSDPNFRQLQLADAPAGGAFGPTQTPVTPATGKDRTVLDLYSVAFDSTGGLFVAAAARPSGGDYPVFSLYRPAGKSSFDPPVDLIAPRKAYPRVMAAISGPGRISVLDAPLDPVRENGERMVLSRRSRLLEPTQADQSLPTVKIGAVTQSAKDAGGKSTLTTGFTISESASVTATLSRKASGVLVNGACVAPPTTPPAAPAPACLRRITIATTPSKWTTAKTGSLVFATAPTAGTYTLAITARDAAGNQGAAATSATVN